MDLIEDRAVVDPRTAEVIDRVALLPVEEVPGVVAAARQAFTTWSRIDPVRRSELLFGMADVLSARTEALKYEYSREHGKTPAEAGAELDRMVDTIEWFARATTDLLRPMPLPGREGFAGREVLVEPAGPVLAIVPWNFPAVVLARKLAPALAVGCSVVIKAPEETPSVARAIAAAAEEAGLPAAVVQVVFGAPSTVAALVRSPGIMHVSFTGSTRVGRLIAGMAADNLTPCTLELGGHAPAIVTADADLDLAAQTLVRTKFGSAGQSCGAPSRFLVERPVYAAFLERFCDLLPGFDFAGGTLGPLNSIARRDAVRELVVDAAARGATVLAGGVVPDTAGFYYPATVLSDVPSQARVMTEEPFGPIAPFRAYDTDEEAVALANSTDYALSAYVFGATSHAAGIARRLDAGGVSINVCPTAFPDAPLGGRHASGYGYEGGHQGLLAFGRLKIVQTSTAANTTPTIHEGNR
ncbi:aldehyde dehydrogenase family protein [Micromonospora orduensis]|uniref:Aldehyde dehydrogenase family protein n=1 Tax=Micromonospora orduensis TaxID=1420891 RepID=A0A5C4QBF0_9ACTN|nr:aldehyde dehydrogenase family protein [Micromonospora orduensis]TNH22705.1 aldehyde dehydrogenase family protein [Micromonospora orduensis]